MDNVSNNRKIVLVAEVVEDKACWIAPQRPVIFQTWTAKGQLKKYIFLTSKFIKIWKKVKRLLNPPMMEYDIFSYAFSYLRCILGKIISHLKELSMR